MVNKDPKILVTPQWGAFVRSAGVTTNVDEKKEADVMTGVAGTDIVVYDLEIAQTPEEVGGWNAVRTGACPVSFGVSYSYRDNSYRVFSDSKLPELRAQVESAGLVVGFNHIAFDNALLASRTGGSPLVVPENYDILRQVQKAVGMTPGYTLSALAQRTLGDKYVKEQGGEMAPQMFKDGKYDELITYCQRDVYLTKTLFEFIMRYNYVIDVQNRKLSVRLPQFSVILL